MAESPLPHAADPLALDPAFFRRLEQLALVARRLGSSSQPGKRLSRGHGSSVEFADFRDYLPGDDPRFIDWNAFARLDRLFLKLFHEEAPLALHLLVDCSPSMDYGTPGKFTYARQLAAALAYVALAQLDQAAVCALRTGEPQATPLTRGKRSIFGVLDFLRGLRPEHPVALNAALRRYAARPARNALAVIISDCLDPAGLADGLKFLRYRGYQAALLQVLSPDEWEPSFTGDFLLRDCETGHTVEVTASGELFARYRSARDAWTEELAALARDTGCAYARLLTTDPLDTVVLRYLRQRHLLR